MLENIDVSLSLGQLIYGRKWIPVICFFLMGTIFPILSLIMCFLPMDWDSVMLTTIVLLNLFSLLILILPVYIIIKDRWIKKQVKLWMQDAVKLDAHSKAIDEHRTLFGMKGSRIQVTFEMNGTNYVLNSTVKMFGGQYACLTSFTKYANRKINILYSPKYDEVMILKD